MKRFLPLTLALLCALFIAGCIDYEETLELNADGSGTMAMHVTIYKKYFEAMSAMTGSSSADSVQDSAMFKLFTREDMEAKIKEHKSTVKLLNFKEQLTDSTVVYDLKYAFNDLQEMLRISGQMGKNEMMGGPGSESVSEQAGEPNGKPEITFRKEKSGQWQYTRGFAAAEMGEMMLPAEDSAKPQKANLDTAKSTDSLAEPLTEAIDTTMAQMGSVMAGMKEMMEKAFADRKMRMTVKFPGTVVTSNATSKSGNTAVWEYKFTDMAKAPKQLEATIKP
jgi:uncharacterized lipoprotein YehR (DUF1307 family)